MLSQTQQIRPQKKIVSLRSKDFQSFFKNAKKIPTPLASFYIKVNQLNLARLGIVVKKSFVKSAVKRNRIKRVVRAYYRSKIANFVGYDLVVIINKPKNKEAIHSFRSDLVKQWSKLDAF
ncbi:MAG: ribonuclease P protein component [Gammaproteobacteria bacterium]|nr:ribonuclease P protein component [Gammaproteobacteria bacterium]